MSQAGVQGDTGMSHVGSWLGISHAGAHGGMGMWWQNISHMGGWLGMSHAGGWLGLNCVAGWVAGWAWLGMSLTGGWLGAGGWLGLRLEAGCESCRWVAGPRRGQGSMPASSTNEVRAASVRRQDVIEEGGGTRCTTDKTFRRGGRGQGARLTRCHRRGGRGQGARLTTNKITRVGWRGAHVWGGGVHICGVAGCTRVGWRGAHVTLPGCVQTACRTCHLRASSSMKLAGSSSSSSGRPRPLRLAGWKGEQGPISPPCCTPPWPS